MEEKIKITWELRPSCFINFEAEVEETKEELILSVPLFAQKILDYYDRKNGVEVKVFEEA